MATPELTISGMMSLARLQVAPLSPIPSPVSQIDHSRSGWDGWEGSDATKDTIQSEYRAHDNNINVDDENAITTTVNKVESKYKNNQKDTYLGMSVTLSDLATVREFEQRWAHYVQLQAEGGGELPKGRRELHIEQLQGEIRILQQQTQNAEGELMKRLAFVRETSDALLFQYRTLRSKAVQEQQQRQSQLTRLLDTIAQADSIGDETLPWLHFFRQLDREAQAVDLSKNDASAGVVALDSPGPMSSCWYPRHEEEESIVVEPAPHHHATAIRPSCRALYLAQQQHRRHQQLFPKPFNDERKEAVGEASSLLQAYRIDHALLSTHISMLRREIERYEKRIQAQEMAGNFLIQHNVWSILEYGNDDNASTSTPPEPMSMPDNHCDNDNDDTAGRDDQPDMAIRDLENDENMEPMINPPKPEGSPLSPVPTLEDTTKDDNDDDDAAQLLVEQLPLQSIECPREGTVVPSDTRILKISLSSACLSLNPICVGRSMGSSDIDFTKSSPLSSASSASASVSAVASVSAASTSSSFLMDAARRRRQTRKNLEP